MPLSYNLGINNNSLLIRFLFFVATVRTTDVLVKQNLVDFGKYVAECLPKYVQKVQIATGDELEILIAPEGVLPVLQFLKDHHNCQFSNLSDLCAVDIPQRSNRFEVKINPSCQIFDTGVT